ncbi:hypothetical protein NiCM35_07625 [Niallia circulans]|uniref:hypothetical protein n=1 Tax=Niallia circulans TaxID=1397 RepID=UPI003D992D4B
MSITNLLDMTVCLMCNGHGMIGNKVCQNCKGTGEPPLKFKRKRPKKEGVILIGKKIKAIKIMNVRDIEDESIPPTIIKPNDIGVIKGVDDYPNGKAYEVKINGEDIFIYGISNRYWEIID